MQGVPSLITMALFSTTLEATLQTSLPISSGRLAARSRQGVFSLTIFPIGFYICIFTNSATILEVIHVCAQPIYHSFYSISVFGKEHLDRIPPCS